MLLGNFSVSLTVKDLTVSKEFYQKLGFTVIHGVEEQGWLILQNGETNIGLFQGMFKDNLLTFNPGWDSNGKEVESFVDIREIEKQLKAAGITLDEETKEKTGPAHISLRDPDGNQILIDQHR